MEGISPDVHLTDARVARGVDFWRSMKPYLARAEQEYGVPAQVIVAIIGIETFYGRNTGSYRVIDALSTLGFDYPPRADFFRKELREFLLLAREEQVDPLTLKGSYAGAMGLPQFMPSSFRAYAVDFDGDGHINIWSNPDDAIGSVASYFKRHGWVAGEPVVIRADVSGERADEGLTHGHRAGQDASGSCGHWAGRVMNAPRDDMPVTAFRLEGENGPEYWMGLKNFYAITRYNRSVMYAMAVHQLSEHAGPSTGRQVMRRIAVQSTAQADGVRRVVPAGRQLFHQPSPGTTKSGGTAVVRAAGPGHQPRAQGRRAVVGCRCLENPGCHAHLAHRPLQGQPLHGAG